MNPALPIASIPALAGKKRILLLATHATKRDLRAQVLRKLGVEVDCAADISEARSLWRADSYNLVLVDVRNDSLNLQEFCTEIRGAKPPQAVAFLVGKPAYLAASPDESAPLTEQYGGTSWSETVATLFLSACEALPRRYGFLEACWRIAAARSLKDPRQKTASRNGRRTDTSWADAIQQHSKPALSESQPLIGLANEEIS